MYNEYAILESQIKALTLKKEEMRGEILLDMIKRGVKKEEHALGSFSRSTTKSWTYPEDVVKLGDKFKAAKAKSESTGEATYEESDTFRFNLIKI